MLVSIIIPTFNCQKFIVETVRSALNQKNINKFEVIIVDDHSTDNTQQILLDTFGEKIIYLKSKGQKNVAAARNTGADIARGKMLAFLDADDLWLPDKLEKQCYLLDSHEELSLIATNFIAIGDEKFAYNPLNKIIAHEYRDFNYHQIILKNPIVTSSAIVRRCDFEKIGGFDEDPRFMFMEDWDLWLRLSLQGKVRVLKNRLVKYRVYFNKNRDFYPIYYNALALLNKHKQLGFLKGFTEIKAKANCYVNIGRAELTKNHRKKVVRHLLLGVFLSSGVQNKTRSLVGLLLLFFPYKIRLRFIHTLIMLRNRFFSI